MIILTLFFLSLNQVTVLTGKIEHKIEKILQKTRKLGT